MQLIKSEIMQPIETVLRSVSTEEVISVLQVVVKLAFASDTVSQKMLTKDVLKSLKFLCAHKNPEASCLIPLYNAMVFNFHRFPFFTFILIFKIYLSIGAKVSFVSSWKFGLLFGESSTFGYF